MMSRLKTIVIILMLFLISVDVGVSQQQNEIDNLDGPNQSADLNKAELMTEMGPEQINEIYGEPEELRSFEIKLRSGNLKPKPNKDIKVKANLKSAFSKIDNEYYLIQFENKDEFKKEYETLKANGVRVLNYIPDNTFIVKIPKKAFEKKYNSIRWINILEPEQKLNPEFRKNLDLSSAKLINITILFFENLTNEQFDEIKKISKDIIYYGAPYNLVTIQIEPKKINEILNLNFVEWIEPETKGELFLDQSSYVIGANYVQSSNDASGITVGIIDTGIQRNHPHFSSTTVFYAHDFVNNDGVSEDDEGHGTHVAGTISGSSTFDGRTIKGISNRATITMEKVLNAIGMWDAPLPQYNDIWTEILDPDNDGNFVEQSSADVISNSWGFVVDDSYSYYIDGDYTSKSTKVDEVVNGQLSGGKKVLVIMAAGNYYQESYSKVAVPGTAKNALTVGASADFRSSSNSCQHGRSTDPNNFYVMGYSSRGTDYTNHIKPDILAPGSDITSSVLTSTYDSWDGTSMAAPHVSAVAAQIIKEYSASPNLIKAFIIGSADGGGTTNSKNMNQAWGRLNAYSAVKKEADEYYDSYGESSVGNLLSGRPNDVYYNINVPSGAKQFIITMTYSDDAGLPLLGGLLLNDLDLYLVNPSSTTYYYNDDNVNNVEKYRIDNPASGIWQVHIKAIGLNDLFGVIPKAVDYAVSIRIIKQSTTPSVSVDVYQDKSTIKIGDSFLTYGAVNTVGYELNDMWARLSVPSGLTITSSGLDGTDYDRHILGIIADGNSLYTKTWTVRGDSYGSYTIYLYAYGKRRDLANINTYGSTTIDIKKKEGDLCLGNSECYSSYCQGSSSYSARCCLNAPPSDGWYDGGEAGCGVWNDPTNNYRDYYCDSSGSSNYQVTNTKDCDSSDGWSNYGDNGCGTYDDPTAEQRDYYASGGSCSYCVYQSKDCDSSDGWYDGGDSGCGVLNDPTAYRRDYYVTSSITCDYCNAESKDCDSSDGWGGGGDSGPGCSQTDDPAAENRDYYVSSGSCTYCSYENKDCDGSDNWYGGGNTQTATCGSVDNDASSYKRDYYATSTGSCTYTTTNCPTKDCDSDDVWVGGENTPGCGNDPSSEWRDYYVESNTQSCTYTTSCSGTNPFDCDNYDQCSTSCNGNIVSSYKDYYVVGNTNTCTYVTGDSEDCTIKNSYDSDLGNDPMNAGYCYDYNACSFGSCVGTQYNEVCSGDSLLEYYASGTSCLSQSYNCNSYDGCSSGTYYDYSCGAGKCSKVAKITDNDGDGYDIECENDCNDNDATVYPGAAEICDNKNNDCDIEVDEGFVNENCKYVCEKSNYNWAGNGGNLNCCGNDANEDNPYEPVEISCSDGRDNNCDGSIDSGGACSIIYCDSSPCIAPESAIKSRDNINGQAEPNQPNTIDGCIDGTGGTYLSDESVEKITITNLNGNKFYGGDTIKVDVLVYCYSGGDDFNFVYASNSKNPSWVVKGVTNCAGGYNTLSKQFGLDNVEGVHAIRALLRWGGSASDTCGSGSYDDNDDVLIFVKANVDNDGDGYFTKTDCNDDNANVNPGKAEIACDGIDQNCDGSDFIGTDNDLDSYKKEGGACGSVDCNDNNANVNPSMTEICDGIDNNCDGITDGENSQGCTTYYKDSDNDTYGTTNSKCLCSASDPYDATNSNDCNDNDVSVNPGKTEILCDGVDQDCSGGDNVGTDNDNDGYKINGGLCGTIDCNDNNNAINPGATETCDGIDNNCNYLIDEENALSCAVYYKDYDNDGYGIADQKCLCSILNPFRALQANDCNDNNVDVNPAAIEICNDNIDNDCDLSTDESGCNEKCDYIGAEFLVSGSLYYCDIDKIAKPQKADSVVCQNNFECLNNLCSNNICVNVGKTLNESKSLLQQIISLIP